MFKTYFTEENQFLITEVIGSILTEQYHEATGSVPMLRCLRPDIRPVSKAIYKITNERSEVFEITYRVFENIAIQYNLIDKKPYYDYELSMLVGDVLDDILKIK